MKTATQLRNDPYNQQFIAAYYSQFSIPDYILKSHSLEIYKRLVWSESHFLDEWAKNAGTYAAGTIHKYNQLFHVNFKPGCSIGQIKKNLIFGIGNAQVTISFRKAAGFPAICIVDFNTFIYKYLKEEN